MKYKNLRFYKFKFRMYIVFLIYVDFKSRLRLWLMTRMKKVVDK